MDATMGRKRVRLRRMRPRCLGELHAAVFVRVVLLASLHWPSLSAFLASSGRDDRMPTWQDYLKSLSSSSLTASPPLPLAGRGKRPHHMPTSFTESSFAVSLAGGWAVGGGAGLVSLGAAAASAAVAGASRSDMKRLLIRARPGLLIAVLVLQKCATDALTWYTRNHGAPYSGASVALLSEVFKYPVLAIAVATFESPSAVLPTFRSAVTDAPFALAWIGAAYAAQNLLYFVCLGHISAAGYQVLSQSKLIFTAMLMRVLLGKRFTTNQTLALTMLVVGAVATQVAESSSVSLGIGGNALLGCGLTVLSALLSALPNVFYERLLKKKEGQSEWAVNIQLTSWILFWILLNTLVSTGRIAASSYGAGGWSVVAAWSACVASVDGFTPMVWFICFLKTLNCVIIPACLKYGDNILYGYAKPVSIILTCMSTAAITSSLPPPMMFVGIAMVLGSMALYGK